MPEYTKSPIQKFDTVGQTASGPFGGIRKGKFESNLVQIGDVTYGSSKVLDEKLKDVPHGTFLSVTYTGLAQPKKAGGKPYKNYTFNFGNETQAPAGYVPKVDPAGMTPVPLEAEDMRFLLLLSRLKLKKGDHITRVIKSACEFSNDPYEALVSAVNQMGLAELLVESGPDDVVPF